jgi:hypothetical protein
MKLLRNTAVALLTAVSLLATPVTATSFSTDQSDLWYIVAESGWGMQLVQRGNTIFATLFVYGQNGAPTWYVATMSSTDGSTWTGDLYATTGPWFGTVPFNPSNVFATKVGTMTWSAQADDTGNVSYSVNGTQVSKNVVRQTLVFDDYSGAYLVALHVGVTGCTNPADNLPPSDFPVPLTITVTQSGQSVTITFSALGMQAITITGTLSQSGQFGSVIGTYTDPSGDMGNASVTKLIVQENALTGSFTQQSKNQGCQSVGSFAGLRAQP